MKSFRENVASDVKKKTKTRNNNILSERITFASEKNYVYFKNTAVPSFLPFEYFFLSFCNSNDTIRGKKRKIHQIRETERVVNVEKVFTRKTPQCIKIGSDDIRSHAGLVYVDTSIYFWTRYSRRCCLLRYVVSPKVAYKCRKKKKIVHTK